MGDCTGHLLKTAVNVEKAQSDASKLIDQHENLKGILGITIHQPSA